MPNSFLSNQISIDFIIGLVKFIYIRIYLRKYISIFTTHSLNFYHNLSFTFNALAQNLVFFHHTHIEKTNFQFHDCFFTELWSC